MLKVFIGIINASLLTIALNAGSYDYMDNGDHYTTNEIINQCTVQKIGYACKIASERSIAMYDDNASNNLSPETKRKLLVAAFSYAHAGCKGADKEREACELIDEMIIHSAHKFDLDTPIKRLALMEESCFAGYAYACTEVGDYYAKGDAKNNIISDHKRAQKFYEQGIKTGDADANLRLDFLKVANMSEGQPKKDKLLKLSKISCDKKSAKACLYVGGSIGQSNPQKAYDYVKKSCALGNQQACTAGLNLLVAYRMQGVVLRP